MPAVGCASSNLPPFNTRGIACVAFDAALPLRDLLTGADLSLDRTGLSGLHRRLVFFLTGRREGRVGKMFHDEPRHRRYRQLLTEIAIARAVDIAQARPVQQVGHALPFHVKEAGGSSYAIRASHLKWVARSSRPLPYLLPRRWEGLLPQELHSDKSGPVLLN